MKFSDEVGSLKQKHRQWITCTSYATSICKWTQFLNLQWKVHSSSSSNLITVLLYHSKAWLMPNARYQKLQLGAGGDEWHVTRLKSRFWGFFQHPPSHPPLTSSHQLSPRNLTWQRSTFREEYYANISDSSISPSKDALYSWNPPGGMYLCHLSTLWAIDWRHQN